jgi:hypothetical protein
VAKENVRFRKKWRRKGSQQWKKDEMRVTTGNILAISKTFQDIT